MTAESIERVNYFDFQKITVEDLETDQSAHILTSAANINALAGSGILLEYPQEIVVFDSSTLDDYQQGLVAIDAFDGQGILEEPYLVSDQIGGSQLAIEVVDTRLSGSLKMSVLFLGKSFDSTLMYEIVEIGDNITEVTKNHFKEVTNILFQNFLGNANTSVDGYGSFNVGGSVKITEASSYRLSRDYILAEQILEPNMPLRNFKTATAGKTLSVTIREALGPSNDINDLDINTTAAQTRLFEAGGSTSIIYGQKFKMSGNNIQKVSLLLSLESGTTFTGTLVLGIRKLQTSENATSEFLPDDDIAFDPDMESLEEIAVNNADLLARGYSLNQEPQIVDFLFTGSNLANPALELLDEDEYYVLTIRRTGSVVTGTIVLQEARNDNSDLRLTVFENSVWTDVEDSSMWFRIYSNAAKVASGVAYNNGIRVVAPKVAESIDGIIEQKWIDGIDFVSTAEDAENYIILQDSESVTHTITHPRTGDLVANRKVDAPLVSSLNQDDTQELITNGQNVVILGRMRDRNPKSNPAIADTIDYPGLVVGNVINIINPSSDFLTQNVVGSVITPNTLKPTLKYRIISQTVYNDLYGDLDGDGIIDVDDLARLVELDGYAVDLNGGSVSSSVQKQAVLNGSVSIAELLRADVDGDGLITTADDGYHLTRYISDGIALPEGSSFTRVELEVEAVINPLLYLDSDASSTLELQDEDPDLIDNTSFSVKNLSVEYIPTWEPENIEVVDLRRFITTTFIDFNTEDLTSSPENGGTNSLFVPGSMYLSGSVRELDGTHHPLDYERNIIEIELPDGTTVGELNLFTNFVVSKMSFSDGTLVSASAINDNQIKFEVSISSYAKLLDGYDSDGYGGAIDEVVGTYMDHSTGILRINAANIVRNVFYPELRTRLQVVISLKKAGFNQDIITVSTDELSRLLVI